LPGAEITTIGPRVEVLRRLVAFGEEAGRLHDDVDAQLAPRQRRRISREVARVPVDLDPVPDHLDVGVERRRIESYFSRWAMS
jgi:hypothetical protein